jgi:hypothetical protein
LFLSYPHLFFPLLQLSTFASFNKNLGDEFDYGQRKSDTLGDVIQDTLNTLERHGGDDAFINIKYMVPTYESAVA